MNLSTNKTPRMVTGAFRSHVEGQNAYDALLRRGYGETEISVVMSDETRDKHFPHAEVDHRAEAERAVEGMGVGGVVGTVVGATLAALIATAVPLVIPLGGMGLVIAGPLGAALAGGGAGAALGGTLGALVAAGVPEPNARAYEQVLKDGGMVVAIVPHSDEDADMIKDEFRRLGGEGVCYS